jgi:hypothetical protein
MNQQHSGASWTGGDRQISVVIEPEQVSGRRARTW